MGEAAHPHHPDHARRALHGVRFAQDPVDSGLVVRIHLERHQPGRDPFEVALRLLYEEWSELVF
jgi:hypothetical protein